MDIQNWQQYIPNLGRVLEELRKTRIIFVGKTPYAKIVPALFLYRNRYVIYSLRDCKEIDLLREYCPIYSFEERFPKLFAKKKSVTRMLHSAQFQENFLKSQKGQCALIFNIVTEDLRQLRKFLEDEDLNISLLGNSEAISTTVAQKGYFRELLKRLDLPSPPSIVVEKHDFTKSKFKILRDQLGGTFVCQQGDDNYAMEGMGTITVETEADFQQAVAELSKSDRSRKVLLTKFIAGNAVSMLGCVVHGRVLASPLQTQLIDIPELLQGKPPRGTFMGHDWGLRNWSEDIEAEADGIVRKIGSYLHEQGYQGIFGIDFIYDETNHRLYPIECNPRLTGSFPFAMLFCLQRDLPPFELFHLSALLGLGVEFDSERLNRLYKQPTDASHVYVNVSEVSEMRPDIEVGIYRISENETVEFVRTELFPWDIQEKSEFLLIDAVFRKGQKLLNKENHVFQLFFPCSVAESSYKLKPTYQKVVQYFIDRLVSG